jgi:alpha-tubulin suppressor-like RCC1 family protein
VEDRVLPETKLSSSLLPLFVMLALLALALNATGSPVPAAPWAPLGRIVAIDTGWSSRCAVTIDEKAYCWGAGIHGQLGNGDIADALFPVPVAGLQSGVVEISAGAEFACARVRAEAGAFSINCWGTNPVGTPGNGTARASRVPLAMPALHGDIVNISAGLSHACAVVDGAAACWGSNWYGQLGSGSPSDPVSTPLRLEPPVQKVVAGSHHTCALLAAGTVRCWGAGSSGQIGSGSTHQVNPTPVAVAGLEGVRDITAGGAHTCALLADGRVACWGANWWGQLGDGTTVPRLTPIFAGITSAATISAGSSHTCAVSSTGAAYCWGDNASGQLGDGGWDDRASPTPVAGLQGAVAISAGTAHTCAILTSGHVSCWGAGGPLLGVDREEPDIRIPMPVLQPPSPAAVVNHPGDDDGYLTDEPVR